MNNRRDFKTSDLRDIINYASNMEHLDHILINYKDLNGGIWNITFNLISTKGINLVALTKNALNALYKTYPIESYIMERNGDNLEITLYKGE